jgi:organic radical activating enzyme|tara:strand:+ start:37 stop:696 length:660 start_codon:yes stop_codon:yes gene_type:complete
MGNPNVSSNSTIIRVNSIFYTIQGEGFHSGARAVFIRLSGCNLACGFCDTEFKYGEPRPEDWMLKEIKKVGGDCKFIVLTGGEPSMQNIQKFVDVVKEDGYYIMIETNGMFELPKNLDWVCCSPKINPQSKKLVIRNADEYKFVVPYDGRLPNTEGLKADHFWISPENETNVDKKRGIKVGDRGCSRVSLAATKYCVDLIKDEPRWKLNLQMHKFIGVA